MRGAAWMILLVVAALLSAAVSPLASSALLRPDWLVVLLIFIATRAPLVEVLPWCWAAGLMKDICSIGAPGAYEALYLSAGAAVLTLRTSTDVRGAMAQAILAFLVAAGTEAAYLLGVYLHAGIAPHLAFFRPAWLSSLATSVAAPAVGWALDGLGGKLGIRWEQRAGFN